MDVWFSVTSSSTAAPWAVLTEVVGIALESIEDLRVLIGFRL